MSENENKVCPVSCKIEHHAMMFAFLAKHAIELCGEAGKDAILAGMTTYTVNGNQITPDKWTSERFAPNRHFRLTLQNVHGVKHGKSITLPNMGNIIASM